MLAGKLLLVAAMLVAVTAAADDDVVVETPPEAPPRPAKRMLVDKAKSVPVTPDEVITWSTGPYAYDGAGNITRIGNENFIYDGMSRLRSGQVNIGTLPAPTQSYTYDAYGNITSITTTPAIPATDRAQIVVDPSTNRIAETRRILLRRRWEHDSRARQRLADVGQPWFAGKEADGTIEEYVYAPGGERIAIFKSGWSLRTLRGTGGLVLREISGVGAVGSETLSWSRDYVYRGSRLLATETSAGRQHFHLDHLGTPRLITNASGVRVAFHTYYPFGQEVTAIQDLVRMKFTGHERDEQSGSGINDFDYMHARYYDTLTARFASVDPYGAGYMDANLKPMTHIDPDGLQAREEEGGGDCEPGAECEGMSLVDGLDTFFNRMRLRYLDARRINERMREALRGAQEDGAYMYAQAALLLPIVVDALALGFVGDVSVYVARDAVTGKVIYVGITNNLARRALEHAAGRGIQDSDGAWSYRIVASGCARR